MFLTGESLCYDTSANKSSRTTSLLTRLLLVPLCTPKVVMNLYTRFTKFHKNTKIW